MTAQRVTSLYDVMDADTMPARSWITAAAWGTCNHSPVKRGRKETGYQASRILSWAEEDRLRERTMVERVYARLKDEFGAGISGCVDTARSYASDVRIASADGGPDSKLAV